LFHSSAIRCLSAIALSWGALASPASAQDDGEAEAVDPNIDMAGRVMDDEAARRHFLAGRSLYDAGSFETAAAEFEEAHQLSNRPELLYNIYLSRRDAGDVRPAAEALRAYLEQMPDVPDRVNLEARLQGLEERIASDDELARQQQDVEAQQRAIEERERARQRAEEGGGLPLVPLIVAGAGAAAMIVGTITGVMALGAASTVEEECYESSLCPSPYDEFQSDVDSANGLAMVTDILLFGGGALVAGGLTWALLSSGGEEEAAPVATAACGPTGCAANLRVGF